MKPFSICKGILFKPDMVVALLSAAYTQGIIGFRECFDGVHGKFETRRIAGSKPAETPLYKKGQVLWVREPWYAGASVDHKKPSEMNPIKWKGTNGGLWYQAGPTMPRTPIDKRGRYRHARFMPRWASRITLEVTQDAHTEPLRSITDEGARNEGFPDLKGKTGQKPTDWFHLLWETIHGSRYVYQNPNPYVHVIKFKIKSVNEWL